MTEFKWSVVFDNADVFLQGLVLTLQLPPRLPPLPLRLPPPLRPCRTVCLAT